jgi:cytochrome P450
VEETLRLHYLGPSIGMLRYATEDIDVDGVTIPRGSGVIPALESANLDDSAFDDPWTMDVTRPNNYHLAFSSGPHFCAGSALARMELQVGLERLISRLPTLTLAVEPGDLRRNFGNLVEGFLEVPVSW